MYQNVKVAKKFFSGFRKNMNINPVNNTSFKSKIVFIPLNAFEGRGATHFYCKENPNKLMDSMIKARNIWTHDIRTCTGGGIVDDSGVLGFHFYDSVTTLKKIKSEFTQLIQSFNEKCKSALLIGSKEMDDGISVKVFDAALERVKKATTPSIFREHTNRSAQSNAEFSMDKDTWFVNTNYLEHTYYGVEKDVSSLEELRRSFKEIKIAPQDRLFIGDEEITRDKCPEIFM